MKHEWLANVRHLLAGFRGHLTAATLKLIQLPKYAPETNPIERVWWRLHETVTRNHRAPTMEALLKNVRDWLDDQRSFYFTAQHPFATAA